MAQRTMGYNASRGVQIGLSAHAQLLHGALGVRLGCLDHPVAVHPQQALHGTIVTQLQHLACALLSEARPAHW